MVQVTLAPETALPRESTTSAIRVPSDCAGASAWLLPCMSLMAAGEPGTEVKLYGPNISRKSGWKGSHNTPFWMPALVASTRAVGLFTVEMTYSTPLIRISWLSSRLEKSVRSEEHTSELQSLRH